MRVTGGSESVHSVLVSVLEVSLPEGSPFHNDNQRCFFLLGALRLATEGPDLRLGSAGLTPGPSKCVSARGIGLAEKGSDF